MNRLSQTGTLQYVSVDMLGSALAVDAAVSDTVLALDDTAEFSEKGGLLRLAGVEYTYTSLDPDADTITLATPVTVAAAIGDAVDAITTAGSQARETTAHVDTGDPAAEPVECVISTDLVGYFTEGEDQAGSSVQFVKDGPGSYRVVSRPQEAATLEGTTVWNPYLVRRLTAATIPDDTFTVPTGWTEEVSQGLTVTSSAVTVVTPGLYEARFQPAYAINASGLRYARIMVNGVQVGYAASDAEAASTTFVMCVTTVLLAVDDVLTVETKQNSGAGLALSVGVGRSLFSMYRVSV